MSELKQESPPASTDKPATASATPVPPPQSTERPPQKNTDTSIQPAPESETPTPDIVSAMPQEFQKGFGLMMSMMPASPIADVAKKLTPEHITKALENADQNNKRQHEARQRESWLGYVTLWGGTLLLTTVVMLVLFKKPDYFTQFVSIIMGVAGGGGGVILWRNRRR